MSEFVQVMKDWRRMCQAMDKEFGSECCAHCPLDGCSAVYDEMDDSEDYAENERQIEAWAAEHPLPVYPTWYEYLFNVIRGENKWPVDDHEFCRYLADTPIHADTAEKLGVKPKEART